MTGIEKQTTIFEVYMSLRLASAYLQEASRVKEVHCMQDIRGVAAIMVWHLHSRTASRSQAGPDSDNPHEFANALNSRTPYPSSHAIGQVFELDGVNVIKDCSPLTSTS